HSQVQDTWRQPGCCHCSCGRTYLPSFSSGLIPTFLVSGYLSTVPLPISSEELSASPFSVRCLSSVRFPAQQLDLACPPASLQPSRCGSLGDLRVAPEPLCACHAALFRKRLALENAHEHRPVFTQAISG